MIVNRVNSLTNNMEERLSGEADTLSASQEFPQPTFMELNGLLSCLLQPITGPYPEPTGH
jgi:hypothetical protein